MRPLVLTPALLLITTSAMVATRQSEPRPGKAPFERVCAMCHGDDAQGDQGPGLVPMTMEFDELLAKVREGGGEMPPISKTQMTDEEVKQVYEYLKSL